jgi:urease accessory protein
MGLNLSHWWRVAIAACLALTLPNLALAHSPIPGISFFYSGMLHPLRVAEQILAMTGLAVYLGQRGLVESRNALVAMMIGLILGLPALAFGPSWVGPTAEMLLMTLAATLGLSVALLRFNAPRVQQVLAFLVAFAVMADSIQEGVPSNKVTLATLGVFCSVTIYVGNIVSLVQWAKREWMRIGVRIVGSWIAAASLMVLSLRMRGMF